MPQSNSNLILRTKLAITRLRIAASERGDELTVSLGGAVGRTGRRLALRPHRGELITLPAAVTIGRHRLDVLDDLTAYTGLPRTEVEQLVWRRSDSFRAEWFLTPPQRRVDDWFYLSSTTYLFGNAAHDPLPMLAAIEKTGARPGRALDFGGGAGNLALALAAAGWDVDYTERSALQKDFVRFRVDRHHLHDRLRILDGWQPLPTNTYDLIAAMDVLEHVGDLDALLTERLLPALRSVGRLAESSPFVRNLSNPMHHEHTGLETLLQRRGLHVEADDVVARIWRLDEHDAE